MSCYELVVRTKVSVNPELDPSIWFLNEEGYELFSKMRERGECNDFEHCLETYLRDELGIDGIYVYFIGWKGEPITYKKRGILKALATDERAKNAFEKIIENYFLEVDFEIKERDF